MRRWLSPLVLPVLLMGMTGCSLHNSGLRAGWAMAAPERLSAPDMPPFVEGAPLPKPYQTPTPSAPNEQIELVNSGQKAIRIEFVALNQRPDDDSTLPPDLIGGSPFVLQPGEVRYVPRPTRGLECDRPAWIFFRWRVVRDNGSFGRAHESTIEIGNALVPVVPAELLANCGAVRADVALASPGGE